MRDSLEGRLLSKKMARKLSNLLKKILPDNYAQKQAEFHQMDAFLKQYFKPEIYQKIQLMSCASQRVVLAAKSPQVAGYLKLQQDALQQEMLSLLDVNYRILVKTNPKGLHNATPKKVKQPKAKRSIFAAQALEQAAASVDDDALKQSLAKLAVSLKRKN